MPRTESCYLVFADPSDFRTDRFDTSTDRFDICTDRFDTCADRFDVQSPRAKSIFYGSSLHHLNKCCRICSTKDR